MIRSFLGPIRVGVKSVSVQIYRSVKIPLARLSGRTQLICTSDTPRSLE